MPKRISIKLLLTAVIAIAALFAATEVWAQSVPYDSFNNGEYEVLIADNFPESVLCDDSNLDTNYDPPKAYCPCTGNPSGLCSTYTWTVTDLVEPYSLSHFSILAPKNIVDEKWSHAINGVTNSGSFETKCDGNGDPSTGFGRFLHWYCTLKWSGGWSGNTASFSLTVLGERSKSPTDFLIKFGSIASNWVTGIIQGPFFDEIIPVGASESAECITVDSGAYPISMSLTRNPVSGYALIGSIRFHKSTDCTTTGFLPDSITQPLPLVFCTGGSSQRNECIRLTAESPGCVDYYVGGTLCQYCW